MSPAIGNVRRKLWTIQLTRLGLERALLEQLITGSVADVKFITCQGIVTVKRVIAQEVSRKLKNMLEWQTELIVEEEHSESIKPFAFLLRGYKLKTTSEAAVNGMRRLLDDYLAPEEYFNITEADSLEAEEINGWELVREHGCIIT